MSDTRKVVINTRHGGFGLSWEAVQAVAARKGLVASWYDIMAGIRGQLSQPSPQPGDMFVGYAIGPQRVTTADEVYAGKGAFVQDSDLGRDDPDLVAVVEELGEVASGKMAALKVVEIPADVEWTIDEYDGAEWVAEVHRTWS